MQNPSSFSCDEDPMQVSPPFTPGEGTTRTSPSHSSTHTFPSFDSTRTLPSSSSASTIPDGLTLSASTSEEENLLARGRDNDENWTWSKERKEMWRVVTGGCQEFYEHWRGDANKSKFLHKFPYKLSLEIDRTGNPPVVPLPLPTESGSRIIVTESYEKMFHHLLLIRTRDLGNRKGAVITGQPGIGKTTFLGFLVVRLLSLNQVVLLCDSDDAVLFYQGQVYTRPAKDAFKDLPVNRGYFPVWTPIDADSMTGGPSVKRRYDIWAVQASSPHPDRYKSWRKQTGAALLGMSLWDLRELLKGLRLMAEYDKLRSELEHYFRTSESSTDPDTNAVLEVLNADDRTCDDLNTSTTSMEEKERQLHAMVKQAFKILVCDATEEVGFAPRDVYNCIFYPGSTKAEHTFRVKQFTYHDLQRTVQTFTKDVGLPQESHLVIAVLPRELGVHHTTWSIGFKSNRIAKMVAATMQSTEVIHLREMYSLLRKTPVTSALAGQFFEAFAHRMISTRWEGPESPPQPTLMTSDNANPRTFYSDTPSSPPLHPPRQPVQNRNRTRTYVDLPLDLKNVTLSGDKYYVPIAPNNPLFDSFTIDRDSDNHTVALSIFQMTTSETHGGSGKGYSYIQSIMTHIRTLLTDDPTATVTVTYFLVCPEGKSVNRWKMPRGWENKITKKSGPEKNMHIGDAFCLRFPGFDYIGDDQSQV